MTNDSTSRPVRRQTLQLPSRKPHIVLAGLIFGLGLLMPVAIVTIWGDATDARADGQVAVAPPPVPEPLAALDNEALVSPDLLAGEVALGDNPTDALVAAAPETDALGNPIGGTVESLTTTSPSATGPSPITRPRVTPLPRAPIAGLTRDGTFGPVPTITDRGTAFAAYRRPAPALGSKKPISLVIGGLGINRTVTQQAIDDLPADVTLSFAAHARGLQGWVDAARADGHEVLIEIPMESAGFNPAEPGADRALRIEGPDAEMTRNLDYLLSRVQGVFGATNYNGEALLQRTDKTAVFVDYMSKTGLGFLTDGAFETPTLKPLAASVSLPYAAGNGLIDPDPIPEIIQRRLVELVRDAKSGSHPVGIGFAYPETIAAARDWADALDAQGLKLVPASAALK